MPAIDTGFYDISHLDTLAAQDSVIHRLDPRAKVLTTLCFVLAVVSCDSHAVSQLMPFFFFPLFLIVLGNLPVLYFCKKLILLSPFVLFIGIFNPFLDRTVMLHIGPMAVSGGWLSFFSIFLRFILTVSVAFLLVATTGFTAVCMALEKLGAPKVFTVQLLFLYRYIFVLVDEGVRMVRARALRCFNGRGTGLHAFSQLIGSLLLRTLDRAQRIHMAMQCRGFRGDIRLNRQLRIGRPEILFMAGNLLFFLLVRIYNVPQLLGTFLLERSL